MKKIFAILLAVVMLVALAACGNKETTSDPLTREEDTSTPSQSAADPGTSGDHTGAVDIDAALSGDGDIIYGNMDAAQKQAMIDAAKAGGAEVTFGADGSTTIVDADGTIMTQNPDGTWAYQDADGGTGQTGGDWPDNEFTRLLPEPDFTITLTSIEDGTFIAIFPDIPMEQLKAYADKLKAAGFTDNIEEEDEDESLYSFKAFNASGYQASVFGIDGVAGANSIMLKQP